MSPPEVISAHGKLQWDGERWIPTLPPTPWELITVRVILFIEVAGLAPLTPVVALGVGRCPDGDCSAPASWGMFALAVLVGPGSSPPFSPVPCA